MIEERTALATDAAAGVGASSAVGFAFGAHSFEGNAHGNGIVSLVKGEK